MQTQDVTIAGASDAERAFLERWHAAVDARDMDAVKRLLAADVSFDSPAVYRPYKGRDMVGFVLSLIIDILPDFHYLNAYSNGRGGITLLFGASVADGDKTLQLQGVDIIELNEAGEVAHLTVMIRPLRCLQTLLGLMQAAFAAKAKRA